MYGKVLTLHCVRLSSAKLSNFEPTDNNKNYLKTGYMVYTTAQINRNFRIKVSGVNGEGAYINTLVGVSGLLRLIGQKEWQKAAETAGNKYVIVRSIEDFIREINTYLRPA